ncbi:Alpha/Beta hydrolase protein [Phaeosphaeriaceae sp. PMI808]|nr:Alpha/Beta hydrolase protein [Phaeosphaeriaceae sp. PMI808]
MESAFQKRSEHFNQKGFLDTEHNRHRLDGFDIHQTSYKEIRPCNVKVPVYVLVPKKPVGDAACPVMVQLHGGGLTTGNPLFKPWFALHLVQLALKAGAILLVPGYRLLPEHEGAEILEDMDSFWEWYGTKFVSFMITECPNFCPNLDRLLVTGESAGGLLGLYSCFKNTASARIRVGYFRYPVIYDYCRAPGQFMGEYISKKEAEGLALEILRKATGPNCEKEHVVVTGRDPPEGMLAAYVLSVTNKWGEAFGQDILHFLSTNNPLQRKIYITHGDKDLHVPINNTRRFENYLNVERPDVKLSVISFANQEHAFDYDKSMNDLENLAGVTFLTGIYNTWNPVLDKIDDL